MTRKKAAIQNDYDQAQALGTTATAADRGTAQVAEYVGSLTLDADLRQSLFGSEVMRHPAKQHIPQLLYLLRRYGVPGGVLLDPFGGSGCAMLGCSPPNGGMDVITVELATHFVAMQHRAWDHFQGSIDMQPVYDIPPGTYFSVHGDSRDLPTVLAQFQTDEMAERIDAPEPELEIADLIITSPSYGGSEAVDQRKKQNGTIAAHGGGNTAKSGYQQIPRMNDNGIKQRHGFGRHSQLSAIQHGYVDTIVTPPPYSDVLHHDQVGAAIKRIRAERGKQGTGNVSIAQCYDDTTPENIGNLRNKAYLDAMAQVWAGCAAVMRPGAVLCCITRDCVRDGKIVPVGKQNRKLIEAAGLIWQENLWWKVERQSFWRTLQKRKNPDSPVIDRELVQVFRKPLAEEKVA